MYGEKHEEEEEEGRLFAEVNEGRKKEKKRGSVDWISGEKAERGGQVECEVSHLINSREIRKREINCSLRVLLVFAVNENQQTEAEDHGEVGALADERGFRPGPSIRPQCFWQLESVL